MFMDTYNYVFEDKIVGMSEFKVVLNQFEFNRDYSDIGSVSRSNRISSSMTTNNESE